MPSYSANSVTGHEIPVDKMWDALGDWATPWHTPESAGGFKVIDVKGTGVGATRVVRSIADPQADPSTEWTEQITSMDAATMTWSYKVTSALPPPFVVETGTFVCTLSCKVTDAGCEVQISASQ